MNKYIAIVLLSASSVAWSMQQVGISQASQALAAMSPQLTQAMRQYSPQNTYVTNHSLLQNFVIKKDSLQRDFDIENRLRYKYPKIRYIAPMYQSPTFTNLASNMRSFSPFKRSMIIYNPTKFSNSPQLEGALLHELGHAQRHFAPLLARYTKFGLKLSFIVGIFFKMISIKYGILGYLIAPRLFYTLYMRFFEEPAADDFAIQHANKDALQGLKESLENYWKSLTFKQKIVQTLYDTHHPTDQSRINKIQRAIDGHPNYNRMVRLAILFTITEEIVKLIYKYSNDEFYIKDGLKKIEEIENNFEEYCDKFEIPAEGRPAYKYGLEMAKSYFLTKLYLIRLGRTDIKEEDVIELITTPNATIVTEEPIIVEEQPEIKNRWKDLFPEYA